VRSVVCKKISSANNQPADQTTHLVPRDAAPDVGRLAEQLVVEQPRAAALAAAAAVTAAAAAITAAAVIITDAEQLRAGDADRRVQGEVVERATDAPRA
jgi:hypothetical protein